MQARCRDCVDMACPLTRRHPIDVALSRKIHPGRHCEEPTGRRKRRPMTGSATKQSRAVVTTLDCFASLANDDPKHLRSQSRSEARPTERQMQSPSRLMWHLLAAGLRFADGDTFSALSSFFSSFFFFDGGGS